MLIECPTCRHSIRVVDLRPGRFTPRCPRCDQVFQLTVPEATGSKPVAAEIDASVFAEPVVPTAAGPRQPEFSGLDWPGGSPAGQRVGASVRAGCPAGFLDSWAGTSF